ncbi:MAG: DUF2285 domain-containing protein [Gammaproteobacteria bacterium]
MIDWRDPEQYRFTEALAAEHWAWEFLRRNPAYQADWRWFIERWRALEADYGAPPQRDFFRWKQDPRAYVLDSEDDGGDSCRVDVDKVLIECWVGARWGLYKFPLDPAVDRPTLGEQLTWRHADRPAKRIGPMDGDYLEGDPARVALGFDLSLPLREQLDRAKRYLQATQSGLRRQGRLRMRTVANLRERWARCLRALDGEAAGAPETELAEVLFGHRPPEQRADAIVRCLGEAYGLRDGGYREILLLPPG